VALEESEGGFQPPAPVASHWLWHFVGAQVSDGYMDTCNCLDVQEGCFIYRSGGRGYQGKKTRMEEDNSGWKGRFFYAA